MPEMQLRAANGQYVCAEGGGGREVVANRSNVGPWETFECIDLGNGRVALRAANGQYVCAEGGGGREVVANRSNLGPWETFDYVRLGNGKVALRAANGQYVCAEGGGGREVVANRSNVGPWETFFNPEDGSNPCPITLVTDTLIANFSSFLTIDVGFAKPGSVSLVHQGLDWYSRDIDFHGMLRTTCPNNTIQGSTMLSHAEVTYDLSIKGDKFTLSFIDQHNVPPEGTHHYIFPTIDQEKGIIKLEFRPHMPE